MLIRCVKGKHYAATQTVDEARHGEVHDRQRRRVVFLKSCHLRFFAVLQELRLRLVYLF